jgi:hypothetical protein
MSVSGASCEPDASRGPFALARTAATVGVVGGKEGEADKLLLAPKAIAKDKNSDINGIVEYLRIAPAGNETDLMRGGSLSQGPVRASTTGQEPF